MRSETDFWKIDEEEWIDFLQNPNKALSGDFFWKTLCFLDFSSILCIFIWKSSKRMMKSG